MKYNTRYSAQTVYLAARLSLEMKCMKTGVTIIKKVVALLILGSALMPALSPAAQAESPVDCIEGEEPLDLTYGEHTTNCAINPATDLDRFEFCETAGDEVRLNVLSASNGMDPNVVIRDPMANIIAQASCNDSCSLTLDTSLPVNGCYTIFISDVGTNELGSYSIQLERIVPVPDSAVHMNYDTSDSDTINPGTDIDFFTFNATAGTDIRLNVLAASNGMDPTVEIRDPNGVVVVDGVTDGATCNDNCSYSVDLSPALSGTYSLLIYDRNTNETGGYELSLWCIAGHCDSDGDGVPDPSGPAISYVTPLADTINTPVDGDFYTFNAAAGTDIRLNVLAASNGMDPTVEIRDPNGAVVVDGVTDGATCNDNCSYSVDLSPALSGTYSLLIYDRNTNETGGYELSLWCLWGDCDSDADGIPDGDARVSFNTPAVLQFGVSSTDVIDPAVDGDTFIFGGTAGDLIQINVLAASNGMDPTVEIRDPNGDIVVNGVADGATCNDNCSYTLELSLPLSGKYTLLIYDRNTNETGSYEIGLQCLVGTCADAIAACGDNCIDVPNIDQLDTDGDGYGNVCDGDLNNDGDTNTLDLNLYKLAHRSACGDDNYDPVADFNGDCRINTLDLNIYKGLHRKPPGPSCVAPEILTTNKAGKEKRVHIR